MVLVVSDKLTVATVIQAKTRLMVALESGENLELDACGGSEVDVAGLQVLLAAKREAETRGHTFSLPVSSCSEPLAQALALAGLCALPLLEIALLVPARLARGLSPFRGSRDHFALRLQEQKGWSRWQVLAGCAALGSYFALAPRAVETLPRAGVLAGAGIGAAALLVTWLALWRIPPAR